MIDEIKRELEIYGEIVKHLKAHIKEGNYDDLDIEQLTLLEREIKRLKGIVKGKGITGTISKTLIPAIKIPKTDEIWNYSNPIQVQKLAQKFLGDDIIYKSVRPEKKYMVKDSNDKWVYFGQMGFEDFTKHKDLKRRQRYLNRATNIKGDWKDNPYSPNNLSINLLW